MTIIPRRDPEIVKAEAEQRYCGNDEKVATTTIDHLTVHGVDITSRYNKALEFEVMAKLVEVLPAFVRDRIATIWCDSKACCCYSITLRRWHADEAAVVGKYLNAALIVLDSGHNGFDIGCGTKLWFDPECPLDILGIIDDMIAERKGRHG